MKKAIVIENLGIAAFLKINGFHVNRKLGPRHFEFLVEETDVESVLSLKRDYVNTPYARFDNELMMLRRMETNG